MAEPSFEGGDVVDQLANGWELVPDAWIQVAHVRDEQRRCLGLGLKFGIRISARVAVRPRIKVGIRVRGNMEMRTRDRVRVGIRVR